MKSKTFGVGALVLAAAAATMLLSSCGGGGGGGIAVNGVISGKASKGPVGSGTMTAYAINSNGTRGIMISSAMTDSAGNFKLNIGPYTGPVMLQLAGGSYKDEATGSMMSMFSSDVMTGVMPAMATGATVTGIQVTPLTSMAQDMAQHMTGQMTEANIDAANAAMGRYFLVSDILRITPMDPTLSGSGAAVTRDGKDYGMILAAMSQEAKDLGMPHSSGMVTAMMQDASDGTMNGMMGSTTISMNGMGGGSMMMGSMSSTAGTTGLAAAMASFLTNTTVNRSGITITDADMVALMTKLSSAPTQTIQ